MWDTRLDVASQFNHRFPFEGELLICTRRSADGLLLISVVIQTIRESRHSDQSCADFVGCQESSVSAPLLLIPWTKSTNDAHEETVKWPRANAKCKIFPPVLDGIELSFLFLRCLEVKTKVKQAVSNDVRVGPSLFRALPRTVSSALRSTRDAIIADENPQKKSQRF